MTDRQPDSGRRRTVGTDAEAGLIKDLVQFHKKQPKTHKYVHSIQLATVMLNIWCDFVLAALSASVDDQDFRHFIHFIQGKLPYEIIADYEPLFTFDDGSACSCEQMPKQNIQNRST